MSTADHATLPVEALQDVLGGLIREREKLRSHGAADQATLERNQQAIVRTQWDLSRALIARHRPGPQPA
jgi:YD repeat-containing protein